MISKINNLPYCKYKGSALRLINCSAWTVDEIIAGNKNNPELIRKITTFKDSDGNIIERAIDFSDKPYINRTYKKRDNVIGQDEFVTSTHIKEYNLPQKLKKAHLDVVSSGLKRSLLWNPVKFITNHLSENIYTGEKILTQVSQRNLLKPQKETHTFIEFPHIINGKISNNNNKILRFCVNTLNNHKIVNKNIIEQGAKLPQNDTFLGIRALDIEDSKCAFAQKFLSEKKLQNKNIKIIPDYIAQNNGEEMTKALFDPADGNLNFVKGHIYKSKTEVAATARHEAEHGWQFYLHARNTQGGTTEWEQQIYNTFGDLPNSLKKEAQEYTDSIRSYVTLAQDRKQYRQNFIEKRAHEEGAKARVLYDFERTEISNQFRHIPIELL